ncbi:acyltransferase domain-containing protein, partial [Streptomyces sp. NBS 14/10]|uniref:acyltransferase domain-containing protein n=1 Tax=Streptomyces sp. NBS 14/10 TaxID=1945643 RepID=UPI0015C5F1ED
MGHSQGEIAAAVVAGVLSLADGARVVALRSQVIGRLAKGGGMVSLAVSEAEAVELVEGWSGRLSVAAVNSPSAVVVAGESGALDELLVLCEGRGVRARRVPVDYASHSPQVEVVRDELLDVLGPVVPGPGEVPLYSSVTGGLVDGSGLDAGYWYTNLRQTVRFETAVQGLLADGFDAFVEVSGHPVLTAAVEQTAEQASGGPDVVVLGTLRRDEDEQRRLLMSLGEAFTAGLPVDWSAVLPADATPVDDLPTYAFQRERYWLEAAPMFSGVDVVGLGLSAVGHGLLDAVVAVPESDGVVLTGCLSLKAHGWLGEHAVFGVVLVPGTALLEMVVRAGAEVGAGAVEECVLEAPLVVPERGGVAVHV